MHRHDQSPCAGYASTIFPDISFKEEAEKIALTLASLPTIALAYTKQALNKSQAQNLDEQLKTEDDFQQKAALTNDFKEGVAAFLEKRKAIFKGE